MTKKKNTAEEIDNQRKALISTLAGFLEGYKLNDIDRIIFEVKKKLSPIVRKRFEKLFDEQLNEKKDKGGIDDQLYANFLEQRDTMVEIALDEYVKGHGVVRNASFDFSLDKKGIEQVSFSCCCSTMMRLSSLVAIFKIK